MPTRDDPFGDYDHIKPVPLTQAAHELQISSAKVDHLRTAVRLQEKALTGLKAQLSGAEKELGEKRHQVQLSALHAFLPPA